MTIRQDFQEVEDSVDNIVSTLKHSYFDSNLGTPTDFLDLLIGQAEDLIFDCKKLQKYGNAKLKEELES